MKLILPVICSLCIFIADFIFSNYFGNNDFLSPSKKSQPYKAVFCSVLSAVAPYVGVGLLFKGNIIWAKFAFAVLIAGVIFLVDFFCLKNKKEAFFCISYFAEGLVMMLWIDEYTSAFSIKTAFVVSAACALILIFENLTYYCVKSKSEIIIKGKLKTIMSYLAVSVISGCVIGYLAKSCLVNFEWLI